MKEIIILGHKINNDYTLEALLAPDMKAALELTQEIGNIKAQVVDLDSLFTPANVAFSVKHKKLDRTKTFYVQTNKKDIVIKCSDEKFDDTNVSRTRIHKVDTALSEYIFSFGLKAAEAYKDIVDKKAMLDALLYMEKESWKWCFLREISENAKAYLCCGTTAHDISWARDHINIPMEDPLGRKYIMQYRAYEASKVTDLETLKIISDDIHQFCRIAGMKITEEAKVSLAWLTQEILDESEDWDDEA